MVEPIIEVGQLLFPYTQLEPNQKPKEYATIEANVNTPIPVAAIIEYLNAF
jgi:hypothetical protein